MRKTFARLGLAGLVGASTLVATLATTATEASADYVPCQSVVAPLYFLRAPQCIWSMGVMTSMVMTNSGKALIFEPTDRNLYVKDCATPTSNGSCRKIATIARVGYCYPSSDHQALVAVMQNDGNFVIYDRRGHAVWSTRTAGNPGAYLAVQDDANVVIYSSSGRPIKDRHRFIQDQGC